MEHGDEGPSPRGEHCRVGPHLAGVRARRRVEELLAQDAGTASALRFAVVARRPPPRHLMVLVLPQSRSTSLGMRGTLLLPRSIPWRLRRESPALTPSNRMPRCKASWRASGAGSHPSVRDGCVESPVCSTPRYPEPTTGVTSRAVHSALRRRGVPGRCARARPSGGRVATP